METPTMPIGKIVRAERNPLGLMRVRGDHLYVVRWPDGVTKAGVAQRPSRWRSFAPLGGELVGLISVRSGSLCDFETLLHQRMAAIGPQSFVSRLDAAGHLPGGEGWTECYTLNGEGFITFANYFCELADAVERRR